tara:strand:+ start:4643 stop:5893 length:1251 start_codon:yes stop_codon:yes gene_type:complete
MKVAIIGRGTSAIIQACAFLHLHRRDTSLKLSIYYDPDVPPISVGESSTPHLPHILRDALGISMEELIENDVISRKRGVTFIGWGTGTPWIHGFGDNQNYSVDGNSGLESFQFDTVVFNKYVSKKLEEKGVEYIAEKVVTQQESDEFVFINGRPFDFVVNCTGWNYDKNLTITPKFHTVNAGYLYRDPDFTMTDNLTATDLTVHRATEDGWEFNLPFPKEGVMKKGYLFNTDYISPEEVTKKMMAQGKEGRVITWKPKRSKYLIESKHTAANGNRLFFVEPLQAYSVLLYIELGYLVADYLYSERSTDIQNKFNLKYRKLMISYEQELAFHYQYGSIYNDVSKFWKDKTKEAQEVMYYHPTANYMELNEMIKNDYTPTKHSMIKVFMHSREDLLYVHKWMTDGWKEGTKPKFVWQV